VPDQRSSPTVETYRVAGGVEAAGTVWARAERLAARRPAAAVTRESGSGIVDGGERSRSG
jgi:hypothetical protein